MAVSITNSLFFNSKATFFVSPFLFLFKLPSIKGTSFVLSLAGGAHRHLEQDHLPVLRGVALVYVPGEPRRAVESGGAVFARVNLGGVHEAQVSLLAGPAGETLPAHRAQQAVHRA